MIARTSDAHHCRDGGPGRSVLLYVQHLLGTGHARRAAIIARALAESGFEVTVAQGGFPTAGADFGPARVVQLAPARAADATFRTILDEHGRPIDAAWRAGRSAALLELYARIRPDVLIVETFPFGRRAFRFELVPLLGAARGSTPRPLIVSSVRDILVSKRNPEREADMAEAARAWFDLVLVHGDPTVLPFGASFPPAARIADLIRHTGYVVPPRARTATPGPGTPNADGTAEVIVSVGGGAVGETLLRTALAARPLIAHGPAATATWRLLAGPDLPDAVVGELRCTAPRGAIVERARPDFPALLSRCLLSVSQAGYNTVMDLIGAGCRSLLVPFATGGETEQSDRARLLAARGLAHVVEEAGLTPERLPRRSRRRSPWRSTARRKPYARSGESWHRARSCLRTSRRFALNPSYNDVNG